ncbi:MAG TPA: intradiol ring-cleavage dioxygenase [Ramlibacter sp.]|nr:intradiol ring-cleavage dioxygenase [Ramlibacter sp.]
MQNHHPHPHGLAHDLDTLLRQTQDRRRALRWLGGAGAAFALTGCGGGGDSSTSTTTAATTTTTTTDSTTSSSTTTTTTTTPSTCSTIPSETAGPYPGDGTNSNGSGTANALALSGIVRSNIVSSIGSASGTATGIPLTVKLNLVNTSASCASLAGYAVYLWHCDAQGRYSMYSSGITAENYLRGVQQSDSAGLVTFTTIFPGCYSGRWPHIHFEVFPSLAVATSGNNDVKTSQLALPQAACATVYADSRYSGSTANLAGTSLTGDNVFGDGSSLQVATVTGNNTDGYVATLQVGVAG